MPKLPYALFSIRGKIVVITGGTGKLGTQYVQVCRQAGARVVSLDLRRASRSAATLQVEADVTDRRSIEQALATVKARLGIADVLVNNAGVDTPPADSGAGRVPFERFPVDEWDRVLDVNLKGTFLCSQV